MRHYSTANMVEKLSGLLGTDDLNEFENGFITGMQSRLEKGTLTGLTERQIDVLERIHNKHFAYHLRERIWILAHTDSMRELQPQGSEQEQRRWLGNGGQDVADANFEFGRQGRSRDAEQGAGRRHADRGIVGAHMADTVRERGQRVIAGRTDSEVRQGSIKRSDRPRGYGFGRWPTEPGMGRVVNGMAHRAHRIRALGNGQVPRVAATAFQLLEAIEQ